MSFSIFNLRENQRQSDAAVLCGHLAKGIVDHAGESGFIQPKHGRYIGHRGYLQGLRYPVFGQLHMSMRPCKGIKNGSQKVAALSGHGTTRVPYLTSARVCFGNRPRFVAGLQTPRHTASGKRMDAQPAGLFK